MSGVEIMVGLGCMYILQGEGVGGGSCGGLNFLRWSLK